MQVEGSVDGKPGRLTVDTGAEKTLVRPDMLATTRLPDAPQRLCGVTGHCVQLKGPVEACIGVGSTVQRLPVYVADMDEHCLLGLDYLTQSKACVDLGRKLVRVHGEDVPLLPEVGCAEVVTAERLHLAPRTESRIWCRLSRVMRGVEGLVEPIQNLQLAGGVVVGRSLVGAGEGLVTVLVANFSDKAQKLPAGTKLGTCEEVERPEESSGSEELVGVRPLPDFLEDLAQRSAAHLTEVTDFTPARLMFGRELRLPVDLTTGRPPDVNLPTVTSSYAVALQENLVEVHRRVRGKLKVAGHAMKGTYDRRTREVRYNIGDRVWLHNPRRKRGLSPKLQSPWEGPYTVLAALSDVTYRIRSYSWNHGEGEDDVSPNSGDEDVADADRDEDEHLDSGGDAMDVSGDIEPGLGAGDALLGATANLPPPTPPERPQRERRKPRWMKDFCVSDN
ncbi:uncharacterized protein LOC134775886 [Penaeus indicus]|uniref:uncharacterized protein LOC134775886 n=1 Tax=Penaeus indicus TaxID=29960 RepID=UPI00300CFD1B